MSQQNKPRSTSFNEIHLNGVKNIEQNVQFWSQYRFVTPHFDCLNTTMLFYKFQWNSSKWSQNIEQNVQFEASIGLWPHILIVSNTTMLFYKFQNCKFMFNIWSATEFRWISLKYKEQCYSFSESVQGLGENHILIVSTKQTLFYMSQWNSSKWISLKHLEQGCTVLSSQYRVKWPHTLWLSSNTVQLLFNILTPVSDEIHWNLKNNAYFSESIQYWAVKTLY